MIINVYIQYVYIYIYIYNVCMYITLKVCVYIYTHIYSYIFLHIGKQGRSLWLPFWPFCVLAAAQNRYPVRPSQQERSLGVFKCTADAGALLGDQKITSKTIVFMIIKCGIIIFSFCKLWWEWMNLFCLK